MSEDKENDLTAMRLASLQNPAVQPARRRRTLNQVFQASERDAKSQEVAEHFEKARRAAEEAAKRREMGIVDDPELENEGAADTQQALQEQADQLDPLQQLIETKVELPFPEVEKAKEGKTQEEPAPVVEPPEEEEPDIYEEEEVEVETPPASVEEEIEEDIVPEQTPPEQPALEQEEEVPSVDVDEHVLALSSLIKTYGQGDQSVEVLKGVELTIERGQIVGLIGPSGSGKSTLLQIAGLLDAPTSGSIIIQGQSAAELNDRERTLLRRDTVGFVYQFHHLLKEFTAVENVMMPQRIAGVSEKDARARAEELLGRVGLSDRLSHRPAKLSGGEQQRVAIARALANRPALLLADEPTGNLDPETAETVFQLLLNLTREEGMAALIATHNLELGRRMDRQVKLEQGQVYEL